MTDFQGFDELQKPEDLVQKLEHDLDRLKHSPQDQYAAFDFFVTAEHIVDWLYPNDRAAREAKRASSYRHQMLKRRRHSILSSSPGGIFGRTRGNLVSTKSIKQRTIKNPQRGSATPNMTPIFICVYTHA